MYINNISVNTRHNHPTVLSRTALVSYFLNNGQYTDPYEISAVSIFQAENNMFPSSVLGTDGLITGDAAASVLMNFANSASLTSDESFDPSGYAIGTSGIIRLRQGVYAVILDPDTLYSVFNLSGSTEILNQVSSIGRYIDVWTLRRTAGSDLATNIHDVQLYEDTFFTITEPLLFRVATRLFNNHLVLGSKTDLKFTNEFTIENTNVDRELRNLFNDSFILNPAIEIFKENQEQNLPSRITVSSFADTSSLCDITSDGTVIFSFDTSLLSTHPQVAAGNFGSITGVYSARLKFQALDQVIYSNLFKFIVK